MAKYIDAKNAADIISEKMNIPLGDLVDVFSEIPTAAVVEVVRCKDCKHCEHINDEFGKDWYQCKRRGNFAQKKPYDFCSYGERSDT